ncbi:mediator of RNA polymerase II transcription subunit 6 [Diaphorina citri]|uniref:Mediator of RNA polymerase II transcription subunit 6 n=1 Tax=Diaphorina citri TaxID=121845 RepID=A0A3Q0INE8_DIACI|nr:mediator of RNA polymerase II transcription subunit 6 [Diaphorina citri]
MMSGRVGMLPVSENPLSLSWHDSAWIPVLNPANIMDYFSERSNPFYDRTCNNEIIKMQRLSIDQLRNMTGLEYIVLHVQEPILYVPLSTVHHLQSALEEVNSLSKYNPNKGYSWDSKMLPQGKDTVKKEIVKEEPSSIFQRQRVDMLLSELTRHFPVPPVPQAPQQNTQEMKTEKAESKGNTEAAQSPSMKPPPEKKPAIKDACLNDNPSVGGGGSVMGDSESRSDVTDGSSQVTSRTDCDTPDSSVTVLPWAGGQRGGRAATCGTAADSGNNVRPGEYVMRSLFADFTAQAEKKLDQVLAEPQLRASLELFTSQNY